MPDGVVGNGSFCRGSLLLAAARARDRGRERNTRDRHTGSSGPTAPGPFDRPITLGERLSFQTNLLETRRGSSPVLVATRYIDANHLRRS